MLVCVALISVLCLCILAGVDGIDNSDCFAGTRVYLDVDFNSHALGAAYTQTQAHIDFGMVTVTGSLKNARIVEGYTGKGLEITYPAGKFGAESTLWFKAPIADTDHVVVSYRIKFGQDFTFNKGGKLPGVCGGVCNTGGFKPEDGNGFSSRVMWRGNGALVSYNYHLRQVAKYGDNEEWKRNVRAGVWYRLTQRIALNTPGKSNGLLAGYIGPDRVYYNKTFMWRKSEKILIDTFHFATFFGGATAGWAPKVAQTVVFDDILLCV